MPVEDKEAIFRRLSNVKTRISWFGRKRKRSLTISTLIFLALRDYLKDVLMADSEMLLMNILCQRFLGGQEDKVADMGRV